MDPTVGAIIVAVLALVGVVYTAWRQAVKPRNPDAGWEAAVAGLRARVDELVKDVATLQTEVVVLETDLANERAGRAADKTADRRTIQQQSALIFAQGSRVTQLERAWPQGVTMPPPDPAWAQQMMSGPE